jgi:hypothetical protein
MRSGKVTDGTYVITIRGVAGPSVQAAFDDVELSAVGDTTVIRRAGTDQAALHGLLHRIQDLGLEVVELHLEPAERTTYEDGGFSSEARPRPPCRTQAP